MLLKVWLGLVLVEAAFTAGFHSSSGRAPMLAVANAFVESKFYFGIHHRALCSIDSCVIPVVSVMIYFGSRPCVLKIFLKKAGVFSDTHMNPCEDFYTYICESQYKNPDGGSISSFKSPVAQAQDHVVAKIKGTQLRESFLTF